MLNSKTSNVLISAITSIAVILIIISILLIAPHSLFSSTIYSEYLYNEEIDFQRVWEAQASIYEVIITSLIGFNAFTGILAFVYVKGKSAEEANESVKKYLNSYEFEQIWRKRYEEFSPDLESYISQIKDSLETSTRLESEIADLKRGINNISKKISQADQSEDNYSEQILINKEQP